MAIKSLESWILIVCFVHFSALPFQHFPSGFCSRVERNVHADSFRMFARLTWSTASRTRTCANWLRSRVRTHICIAHTRTHTRSHSYGSVCITCCSHLQLGKLLSLVAGVLGIDELGEEELVELGALGKRQTAIMNEGEEHLRRNGEMLPTFLKMAGSGRAGPKKGTSSRAVTDTWRVIDIQQLRPRSAYIFWNLFSVVYLFETDLVGHVVRACILHLHHHVRVQEVGLDHVGDKGRVLLLEHDGNDVVAYVSLPLQLGVKQANGRGSNNKAVCPGECTSAEG